ncbi:hypothetical protein VM1G_05663 [Cytospora mali]|uniref:Apple domain-containing protein n=1 Tax=Cytospora mali TaxID=578113 RepID=A0A194VZA6_CYTMA|nr:hypothetical protein VM1G_05663 [Valsa mali]
MISLEPLLVGAALASIASTATIDLSRPDDIDCYTIWEDGYRNNVPTYYETVVHRETSRLYSTSTPVTIVTSVGATSTITATISTTTSTGDGTSTVSASVGFTPLASIIAAASGAVKLAGYAEAKVTDTPKQSNIDALSRLVDCRYYDDCYPYEVNCIVHVKRVVTTTEVVTAQETVTSTVIPVGVTATTTTTQTNTVTASVSATATNYQVCQANNIIANYSANAGWVDAQFNGNLGMSPGTDGTDCCMKCALMGASCQSSAYTNNFLGGNCVYFLALGTAGTCVGTTAAGVALYNSGTTTSNYTFSNSNCGQLSVQARTF